MKYISSIFLVFLLFIPQTQANLQNQSHIDDLRNYIEKLIADNYAMLNDETISKEEQFNRSHKLIHDNLYLKWMAKYTLGRHRRALSKQKINDFVNVYSEFIVKVYADLTKHYNGEKAKVINITQTDKGDFIVNMEIIKPESQSPIKVDYLIRRMSYKKRTKYKVIDIITEGISVLNSHQSEFNNIISAQGIDVLIGNLKEKINN